MPFCVVYFEEQTKKIEATSVNEVEAAVKAAFPGRLDQTEHQIQVWDDDVGVYIDLEAPITENGTKLKVVVRCKYNYIYPSIYRYISYLSLKIFLNNCSVTDTCELWPVEIK